LVAAIVALVACAGVSASEDRVVLGVWYEGGVGALRHDLIPEDPAAAASLYDRNFRDIAAHGLDTVVAPNSASEHHLALLDAAKRHNLRVILELGPGGDALGAAVREPGDWSDARLDDYLARTLGPIASHPALSRVQIMDEPWPELFARYGQVAERLRKFREGMRPFCCLIEDANIPAFIEHAKPDVVAFDCYPLRMDTPVGDAAALGRFRDVAVRAAEFCSGKGVSTWAVIQAHGITGDLRTPAPAELRLMTHYALAAGCKGVFWFLYQTEWWDRAANRMMQGLVDEEYRPSDRWNEVKQLTAEIRSMEKVLARLRPSPLPAGVRCTGYVRSLRDSESGRQYLYVVNPDASRPRRIELAFPRARGAGEVAISAMPSGRRLPPQNRRGDLVWSETLEPGGGALYRMEFPRPGSTP
jgi:hypothetical protein